MLILIILLPIPAVLIYLFLINSGIYTKTPVQKKRDIICEFNKNKQAIDHIDIRDNYKFRIWSLIQQIISVY